MRSPGEKQNIRRRLLFAVIIVVTVLLQNACGRLGAASASRAFLLVPLCVCIAMFETDVAAALFGAFAGVLWDVSCAADGFHAVVLAVLCAVCSILINHMMRNNILTALVLCAGSVAVYELLYMLFANALHGAALFGGLGRFYLPSFFLTLLFAPVCYAITALVAEKHKARV